MSKITEQPPKSTLDSFLSKFPAQTAIAAQRLLDATARVSTAGRCSATEYDWNAMCAEDVQRAIPKLSRRYSQTTVNNALTCVRGISREAYRLGRMAPEVYLAVMEIPGLDRTTPTPSLRIEPEHVRWLLGVCRADESLMGARDCFTLMLSAFAGLNGQEVIALKNLTHPRKVGAAIYEVRVGGLGSYIGLRFRDDAREIVSRWIGVRGSSDGPAVCKLNNRGQVLPTEPVTQSLISAILVARAKQAKIPRISLTALRWHYRATETSSDVTSYSDGPDAQRHLDGSYRMVHKLPAPLTAGERAALYSPDFFPGPKDKRR